MGRYNFPPEELQRRAALSSELKKKFKAKRAAAAAAAGKKGPAKDEKKKAAEETPKIDYAALKAKARDRRNFLAGTLNFTLGMTITTLGVQRFMFPRMLFEPQSAFVAGRPDEFLPNNPIFFKDFRTWIIRLGNRIIALSGRCTHLGCTPAWLTSDGKFKCPCHGSGFRITGVNFEGPAPRALERFKIELADGRLRVETAKLFLFENGGWENPESYVTV